MDTLADIKKLSGQLFIDGALRPSRSTATIDIVEPATEDVIGHIADASDAEVDEAIEIAARARKS